MDIRLAGYNLDTDVISELAAAQPGRHDVTPETLSASYARISRDPRPIPELRAIARAEVERARASNKSIIFQMGHHSVAEHAVFNFDLIGISRYCIEAVEHFRLCSFTEKSQRYITLTDDHIIPEEITRSPHAAGFRELIAAQNAAYHDFCAALKPVVWGNNPAYAADAKKQGLLEGWVKEDARYSTALATCGQLGLTINARALELMFRRFAAHPLAEVRALGEAMYRQVERVAPSIILFVEPSDFDRLTYADLAAAGSCAPAPAHDGDAAVRLVEHTPDGDVRLIAGMLHTTGTASYDACLRRAREMPAVEQRAYVLRAFQHMRFYDTVLREFEHASLTFELIVSAACFGQLKRHRMATLTVQEYDPGLGVTVPDAIRQAGVAPRFIELADRSASLAAAIGKDCPAAAPYALTQAHRRRVLLRVNARELYHIARLRDDAHAQWDIRGIAAAMSEQARRVMPLTFLLLCGKDQFDTVYTQACERV